MSQKIKTSVEIDGSLSASQIANATTDTDKFLVSDGGTIKYRTGAELATDLGISSGTTSKVQHQVKAGVAINKGQAVYVTSADGTNMIVGLASNASEATSSKTMGLLNATVVANGFADVVTEGLLDGLDTSTAAVGNPVWLGTGGNLIYGLANKPYAPNHLVFIGIVTRVNANNGEIFVKVQNGFELDEIHDVDLKTTTKVNGHLLGYNGSLWVNKTIAEWLGYTPYNASNPAGYTANVGTVTSVSGSGGYGGLTLSGSVTTSGSLTLSGTPTGVWPIGISGNAATATNADYANAAGTAQNSDTLDGIDSSRFIYGDNSTGTISISDATLNGALKSGFYTVGTGGIPNATGVNFVLHTAYNGVGNAAGFDLACNDSTTSSFYLRPATGGGKGAWQTIVTSSNVSSYAVPTSRTITINGTSYDLSANRSWTVTASETDTLATVVARGNSANTSIAVRNSISINKSDGSSGGQLSYDSSINQLYLWNSLSSGYFSVYTNNAERLNISSGGAVTANVDMRAPIFYDSNNTGFYGDFASTSNFNKLLLNSENSFNTTTPGLTSYGLTLMGGTSDYANGITWTWGNTNSQAGVYVQSSGAYGTKMYFATTDSFATGAKTAMAIDHSGNVSLNRGTFSNGSVWINNGVNYNSYNENIRLFNATNGVSVIAFGASGTSGTPQSSILGFSDRLEIRVGSNGTAVQRNYDNYVEAMGSYRAPIFYDSNNTGYYVDPASTSNLNGLTVAGTISGNVSGTARKINIGSAQTITDLNISVGDAGSVMFDTFQSGALNKPVSGNNANGVLTFSMAHGPQYGKQIAFADDDDLYIRRLSANSYASWRKILHSGNYTSFNYFDMPYGGNEISGMGPITNWDSRPGVGMAGFGINWHTGVSISGYGGYGGVRLYASGYPTHSGSVLRLEASDSVKTYGTFTNDSSVRSPIFYDSNDTTYYVDPAGSATRAAFLNGNLWINPKSESYGEGVTFNMPTQGTWGGLRWYRNGPAGNYVGNWAFGYFGNESNNDVGFHNGTNGWRLDHSFNMTATGSVRSPIFYDSNNTGYYLDPESTSELNKVYYNSNMVSRNYGIGQIGVYDSTRYQAVFSMGEAYILPANGTGPGNLYGLAWSHPNAGGVAGNLNTHGLLAMENGTWLASLTGSTRARDDMRAPIFYDNNNTAYYVDPSGSSYCNSFLANQSYVLGWFRNSSANTGIYNEVNGNHIYSSGGSAWSITGNGGNIELQFRSNNGTAIRGYVYADTSNNIGFLTSGGGWRFRCDDSGNAIATGDVTAYSDRRVKENIHTIDNALDKVLSLRGVYYNRVDSDDKQRKVGVIAQETLEVLPEVVGQDTDGMYNVAYGNITAVLIEAIKEQQTQIKQLKELVNKLINK